MATEGSIDTVLLLLLYFQKEYLNLNVFSASILREDEDKYREHGKCHAFTNNVEHNSKRNIEIKAWIEVVTSKKGQDVLALGPFLLKDNNFW